MTTEYFNSIIQRNFIPMKNVKFYLKADATPTRFCGGRTTTDVSMITEPNRNAVDLEKEQSFPLGTDCY